MKRYLSMLLIVVTLFTTFSSCKPEGARPEFTFVFLGDSRGNYKIDPPEHLSKEILEKMVEFIIKVEPEFVIFNGDMVAKTAYRSENSAVEEWNKTFTEKLKAEDIKVYITPGNHIIDQKKGSNVEATNYIKLFNKLYPNDNPQNGPKGYRGVSYSFSHKNVHFSTVTSFISHRGKDNTEVPKSKFVQKEKDFEYFITKENRKWLEKDLQNNSDKDFIIFFTHAPLYPVGPHHKDLKSLHAHPEMRDNVANILVKNSVDAVMVSHEHLYARTEITKDNPTNSGLKGELLQLVIGAASAPISRKPHRNDMKSIKYLFEFEYLKCDVYKDKIICTVYNEENKIIDLFTIKK